MRRFVRPILRVLPPAFVVVAFLSFYASIWGVAEAIRVMLSSLAPDRLASICKPLLILEVNTALFGAVMFAAWRILALHPILNWEYRQWLERMPWTPDRPLPMGSVVPGAIDVVVLAVLCWMAGGFRWFSPLMPLIGYVVVLTILTCVILGFTRQRALLYALLFALGLAIRVANDPVSPLLVLTAALPLVVLGLRRSLDPSRWPDYRLSLQAFVDVQKKASRELGWPFGFLAPKAAPRIVRWPDSVLIALLIGWFLYGLMSHGTFNRGQEFALAGFALLAACIIALVRTAGYTLMHSAPISLFGRILTRRWVIPCYDRVFLAPLTAVAAVYIAEALITSLAVPAAIGQPVTAAIFAYVLLAVGPAYRTWQLTGGHRINPAHVRSKAGSYLEV